MVNKNRIQLINPLASQMVSILNGSIESGGSINAVGVGPGGVGTVTVTADAADGEESFYVYSEEYLLTGIDKGMFIFDVTLDSVDHYWWLGFSDVYFMTGAGSVLVGLGINPDDHAWEFLVAHETWNGGEPEVVYEFISTSPLPVAGHKYRIWFEFNHDAPVPPSIGAPVIDGECWVTIEDVGTGLKYSTSASVIGTPVPGYDNPTVLNLTVLVTNQHDSYNTRHLPIQTKKLLAEGETPFPTLPM